MQGPATFYSGVVVTADGNALTFQAADGSLMDAMLGPPWFWAENGILLRPNEKARRCAGSLAIKTGKTTGC